MYGKSKLKGVKDLFGLSVGQEVNCGNVKLSCYHFDENVDPLYNLRAVRDGYPFMWMYEGDYVRMNINRTLFMSDTNMDRMTNEPFIANAKGRVLMAGLGIGLCIYNLMDKLKSGEISELLVVELTPEVITVIGRYFIGVKNLRIVQADIFEYKPEGKFDTIYIDIWPSINTGNLAEMGKLSRRFRKYLNENGWLDSWLHDFLKRLKRKEHRESAY